MRARRTSLHGRRHLADRRAGHEQQAEQRADEQQRRGDPLGQPVRQRTADGEAEESGGVLAPGGILRRTRPQMPQPECGQRDHRRAEDQPRPRLGVGFGAHQHHGDRGEHDRNRTTAEPMSTRRKVSIHWPTGRAASNQELAAITTAMPSSASAMPSRRWPGSRSRALPTERAVDPAPLASINQPARTPRPTVAPADEIGRGVAASSRLPAGRRGRRTRPAREPAFDLLERAPDRAAVLLGMSASLVAMAP